MSRRRPALLCLALLAAAAHGFAAEPGSPVVLLHGLARSAASMRPIGDALAAAGFVVCNPGYPSREHRVAELARQVAGAIDDCFPGHAGAVDFVTHSLGGIIVRQLAADRGTARIGRVVMLAPPNGGSEVVDRLGGWWLFRVINGPAGGELGTSPAALPPRLGPAPFELGVIAGSRSINPLLSLLIPGPDDGKVAIDRTRLAGMRDFIVVPATHPLIMRDALAIGQTLYFLRNGRFRHGAGG